MFIFRIIGLLLSLSPLDFSAMGIYFPYSFLGIGMYLLASLFSYKKFFPFWDIVLFICFIYTMLSNRSLPYFITIVIFTLIQYIYFYSLPSRFNFFYYVLGFGIILSLLSFIFPVFALINLLVLNISMILQRFFAPIKKVHTNEYSEEQNQQIPIKEDSYKYNEELIPDEEPDSPNEEIINGEEKNGDPDELIANEKNTDEDLNYVIPKDQD